MNECRHLPRLSLLAALLTSAAFAENAPISDDTPEPARDNRVLGDTAAGDGFEMLPGTMFEDDTAEVQIINGTKARAGDWPATLIIDQKCTSTVVGPKVILTAAHCVKDGATGKVTLDRDSIDVTCTRHPDYGDSGSYQPDFAICIAKHKLVGAEYERVNADPGAIGIGEVVRLLGFGCNKEGGTDRGFGVLYEGDATIKSLPRSTDTYFTLAGPGGSNDAALCYGDSGGAAYVFTNAAKTKRMIMGVNARGDIHAYSNIATTSQPGFVSWAKGFGEPICGLDGYDTNCHP